MLGGEMGMTESDLERVLERGARRMRAGEALRGGLALCGVGVLLAAGGILVCRQGWFSTGQGGVVPEGVVVWMAVGVPLGCGILGLVEAYRRCRPAPYYVALILDRMAGTAEHLVTWWQLRATAAPSPCPLPTGERDAEMQRGFRAAQLRATLALAGRFDPQRLISMRLPEWSRALWLALLLLCCALLMPQRVRAAKGTAAWRDGGAAGSGLKRAAAGPGAGVAAVSRTPHVQVLKPTDLLVFQLKATDPLLPPAAKAEALKELLKKIGNVPESELAPEVRELLNLLRGEAAAKNGEPEGTQQGTATGEPKEGVAAPKEAGAAQIPNYAERAMTAVEQNFGDVREQLERYYMGETRSSKSEIRRKQQ